jgi:hypothetical protein
LVNLVLFEHKKLLQLAKALPIAIGIVTTITIARLNKRGYVSLPEIYSKIGLPSIKGVGSIHFPAPDGYPGLTRPAHWVV